MGFIWSCFSFKEHCRTCSRVVRMYYYLDMRAVLRNHVSAFKILVKPDCHPSLRSLNVIIYSMDFEWPSIVTWSSTLATFFPQKNQAQNYDMIFFRGHKTVKTTSIIFSSRKLRLQGLLLDSLLVANDVYEKGFLIIIRLVTRDSKCPRFCQNFAKNLNHQSKFS